MKEAAGEANMTVITIILIAVILVVGTFLVNNLMTRTARTTACSTLGGKVTGSASCTINGTKYTMVKCDSASGKDKGYWVKYPDDSAGTKNSQCVND